MIRTEHGTLSERYVRISFNGQVYQNFMHYFTTINMAYFIIFRNT